MKKRILSFFLALVICAGTASQVKASAAPAPDAQQECQALVMECGSDSFDPDYGGGYGGNTLTGANQVFYEWLKADCAKIASGTETDCVFQYKDLQSLNIIRKDGEFQNFSTRTVLTALLMDCPYEMFWYNKVEGWSYTVYKDKQTDLVNSITFKCSVIQAYALGGTEPNKTDPAKIQAANAVLENARAVVDQNSGRSDYEKLTAYRDYICGQVEYNDAAAGTGSTSYGDPWQMIYVFDDDPNTNVVCEGYAKAFKYLCDLSTFTDSVECYIVNGYAPGDHMWNIVRINGSSYLVDVTGCDGSVRQRETLFLAGSADATEDGCTIHMPRYDLPDGKYYSEKTSSYTYKDRTKSLYDASILTLASSSYDPTAQQPQQPQQPSAPAFQDVPAGEYFAEPVKWAITQGITNGTSPTTFSPGQTCTQAQILTFLHRAAGKPAAEGHISFPVDEAYREALCWAADLGMIDRTSFEPSKPCTRATAVSYIWQAKGQPSAATSKFTDVSGDASYADAVSWAVSAKVTDGTTDTTFSPSQTCTRGQIVTFLHRAMAG